MMMVNVNLIELMMKNVPYDMVAERFDEDDIVNAILYVLTTPADEVYEMLEEARFLREKNECVKLLLIILKRKSVERILL